MLQISKDTLSNSTEENTLQISKDTLSNSTEENTLQISKDTLSNSTEENTLQISKDTLSNSTEEKVKALTRELAELVIQFKALEQKVNDNDQVFSTDSLTALTGTIKDLFSTNIEADVFNSDKHSFSTGLEAHYLTIQPGTIVYAHNDSSYILVIWLNKETYIVITPDKYLWQINKDFTLSLPSGDTFLFSYIGTGASNTETTFSGALRIFNNGCTIKGALNYEYSGVIDFLEGITVNKLLQVKGQSAFNGDIDIDGNVTITGDINLQKNLNAVGNITSNGALTVKGDIKASSNAEINRALTVKGDIKASSNAEINGALTVKGDIKASSNAEINGALTVKGDIIQNGASYETHAEKLYTKNNLIITRDGAVSALTSDEVTGIQAKLYDGTNDGQLVFSKDGVARVGDVGDLQPLATREENPKNGAVAVWNSTDKRFNTKSIDTTPKANSTNLITSGGVKSALTKSSVPIGSVILFSSNVIPSGWLLCDGRAVSRTDYNKLFSVIGTTYGSGDGSTTFNLPDGRNRFPEGANGNLGKNIEAGLPNIKGHVELVAWNQSQSNVKCGLVQSTNGAFSPLKESGNILSGNLSGTFYEANMGFYIDASRSNEVYGKSDTVQPPAVTFNYIIKYTD